MEIKELVKQAHENAAEHGFWEDYEFAKYITSLGLHGEDGRQGYLNAIGNRLMLIVGEVSEAHEGLRKNDLDNFREEIADIAIRLADLCGGLDIDLEAEILKKMEYNKARPWKHGKEF